MELIIFCTACFIAKVYGPPLFADPDVQWHIMAGKYIRNLGYIPKHDPWSYASSEQIWYNLSWLWDITISALHDIFGVQGLMNCSAIAHALLITLLFRQLKHVYKIPHEDTALAATAISGLALFEALYARPQLAAYFLLLWLMGVLEGYKHRSALRTIIYVSVISALWVNIHGTFLLIWVVGAAYWLEAILEKKWPAVKILSITGVIAFIASLLNPWGIDVYYGTLRTLNTAIRPYISEWRPFIFGTQYSSTTTLLLIMSTGFIHNKAPLRHKILAAMMLLPALSAIRGWQPFSIAAAPFIALSLEGVYRGFPPQKNALLNKYGQPLFATLITTLMCYSLTIKGVIDRVPTPLNEINFVLNNYQGHNIYNEYDHGGPIIFYGQGKVKHFIDGRAGTAFSEQMISEYVSFITGDKSWESLFKHFPADVAIVSKTQFRLVKTQDFFDDWHLVFEGEVAKVYSKEELNPKPVLLVP